MTAAALAQAAGMPPTTLKSYEDRYRRAYLPADLVLRLAPHLAGRGNPPITQNDVLAMATPLAQNASPGHMTIALPNAHRDAGRAPHASRPIAQDVPLLDSRPAGWGRILLMPEAPPIDVLPRPAALRAARAVFALTIADASLSPRYEPGERVYCDPTRPPAPGGYAVVLLHPTETGQPAHIGKLVSIAPEAVVLRLHQPDSEIALARTTIAQIGRILTTAELLAG
jgi:hypothetical protein